MLFKVVVTQTLLMIILSGIASTNVALAQYRIDEFIPREDPEGIFQVRVPPDWTHEWKSNRFENIDLKLVSPSPAFGRVHLDYMDDSMGKWSSLREVCKDSQEELRTVSVNYELQEPLNYTKYKIGGYPACSLLFTSDMMLTEAATMQVLSLINGVPFQILYANSQDDFDSLLPTVDKIIKSISILK